jgi:hypothetical protein
LGGERRGGHFIDEEADDALAAGGHGVGFAAAIAQLISGFLHAAARSFGDASIGNAVENQRYRGLGNAGQFGHVMHGCALVHRLSSRRFESYPSRPIR